MQQPLRFHRIKLTSWSDISTMADKLFGFVFRGQADATWSLSTSLERALPKYERTYFSATNTEHWMLHEFRRKHHLYPSPLGSPTDTFEWFAQMQHYGAPTRLLDFSESFYIALYFATAFATEDSSVWAVNYLHLRNSLREAAKLPYEPGKELRDKTNIYHIELLNGIIGNHSQNQSLTHVVPVESTRLSERISRQQGLFLVPTNLGEIGEPVSFMNSLASSFGFAREDDLRLIEAPISEIVERDPTRHLFNHVGLIKFEVPRRVHTRIIEHLSMMGITEEQLFPGLDGLARSLIQTCMRT